MTDVKMKSVYKRLRSPILLIEDQLCSLSVSFRAFIITIYIALKNFLIIIGNLVVAFSMLLVLLQLTLLLLLISASTYVDFVSSIHITNNTQPWESQMDSERGASFVFTDVINVGMTLNTVKPILSQP